MNFRHANPGESFGCMFCGKHLSSRSSLQVHISQVHREEQKAKRMIEERLKITNLEDRLKTEMSGAGGSMMSGAGDINMTAEALRLALQQEERLKQELGNLKNMESLLGAGGIKNMESLLGGAGMARMLQMMENSPVVTTGAESGPGSSSGSVPHSPRNNSGDKHETSPESVTHQLRRDVELTKVMSSGGETSLQYQRDIGALSNYNRSKHDMTEEHHEEENTEEVSMNRSNGGENVSPQDMSVDTINNYRGKEINNSGGHMDTALVYPQSPIYSQHNNHATSTSMTQGSD